MTVTDEKGNFTKQYFDTLGRLFKTERYDAGVLKSTETLGYNWQSRVKTRIDPLGQYATFEYDILERPTKTTWNDGKMRTTTYTDSENTVTVTDENSNKRTFAYDWQGRLIAVKEFLNATSFYQTNYYYDAVGNLLRVVDAKNQTTVNTYDDLNRLTQIKFPDGFTETRSYDDVSNLLSRTDPNGVTTSFTYDALNRLSTKSNVDGTVTFTYDKASNRIRVNDPQGASYYTYDARNRLAVETRTINSVNYTVSYTYDKANNIVTVTYPDGTVVGYTSDGLNRQIAAQGYGTFTFRADDTLSTLTYNNNVQTTFSYDSRSRPSRILTKIGATTLLDLNYTYDGANNVLAINTEKYGYDALHRLMGSSGPWGTIGYMYDAVGNRLFKSESGEVYTYHYGTYNRIVEVRQYIALKTTRFTYDNAGNTVTKNDGTNSWTYTYDKDNRLTTVVKNGQTVGQYSYDADGKRVKKVENSVTTIYVYRGLAVLYEKILVNNTVTKYVYGAGKIIAKIRGGTTTYFHQDHLGSTRLVTDSNGASVFDRNYRPFGTEQPGSGVQD